VKGPNDSARVEETILRRHTTIEHLENGTNYQAMLGYISPMILELPVRENNN
jgi:hypothetical protein